MTGLDLEEYTESVIFYIDKCIENVTKPSNFGTTKDVDVC